MKFMVNRTSAYEIKPCPEAVKEAYTYVDVRTTDDPTKIPAYKNRDPSWWYGEGTNHRVEDGHIKRDREGQPAWFVYLDTLEELMEFIGRHGSIVIQETSSVENILCIEIYDTWRE